MLILRIKRCESALAGGRLEEATVLLRAADLRAHRRGQALADQLVNVLVRRGREHLGAGRLTEASEDCRRAIEMGGNQPEAAQLRAAVATAFEDEQGRARERERAAATARRLVEQGEFSLAESRAKRAVECGDAKAAVLVDDVEERRSRFDRCLADASAALDRRDWEAALKCLTTAKTFRPGSGALQAMTRRAGDELSHEAQALADAGHLDAAGALLRRTQPLCETHLEMTRLARQLEECHLAWLRVGEGRCGEAGEILGRLRHVWPKAAWLAECVEHLSNAGDAVSQVRSGPLGLLHLETTAASPRMERLSPATAPRSSMRRFILHVDGAGSYLVLRGDSLDIGPVSGSKSPDVPVMTVADAPTITLSRSDEDYFLNTRTAVAINGRNVQSKLLADGDRVSLGPRCRIEFRRPNPASGSASLLITGARLPWGGVREVLLMHRELLIGPTTAAHVRTRGGERVTFYESGGRLMCRSDGGVPVEVIEGKGVAVGDVSFVVRSA